MPAVGQHGDDDGFPEWSENIRGKIGENPIKFLDRPLSEIKDEPSTTSTLIDGIRDKRRAQLWLATERRLGSSGIREACPRGWVVERIESRLDTIVDDTSGGVE